MSNNYAVPSPTAMREHLLKLAAEHKISVHFWLDNIGETYSDPNTRDVFLPRTMDVRTYGAGLHELGHLIARGGLATNAEEYDEMLGGSPPARPEVVADCWAFAHALPGSWPLISDWLGRALAGYVDAGGLRKQDAPKAIRMFGEKMPAPLSAEGLKARDPEVVMAEMNRKLGRA